MAAMEFERTDRETKGAATESLPPQLGDDREIERVEIQMLLEAVHAIYGFDFRSYAFASIRRRLLHRMQEEGLATISALQGCVLHDPACMERLLVDLTVNVTAMFRDPG